jgi:hypothetical protein
MRLIPWRVRQRVTTLNRGSTATAPSGPSRPVIWLVLNPPSSSSFTQLEGSPPRVQWADQPETMNR